MQFQEVSEWLDKYNKEDESFDLEKEIENIISQKNFLTKEDLIKIVKWRFHKGLEKNRERTINFLEQMDGLEIEKITREAFEIEEESKKIKKLIKIKGIGISLASCILTFHNPERYCVFSTHVYDEIFKIETRPDNLFSTPNHYLDMLNEIRKFSEKYNLSVRDVGKALFKKNYEESKGNNIRIEDISQDERPREKLERDGPNFLSNGELLALIIRTGHQKENAIQISTRLIKEYGLDKLSECSLKELQKIKGIGFAKACQILALFEFNKRHNMAKNKIEKISCAKDVFNLFHEKLKDEKQEHFYILMLDSKNHIIGEQLITKGILDVSIVHSREVFRSAIKNSSAKIILIHNHPSGDPEPSSDDKNVLEKLKTAGDSIGIGILDFVIIGRDSYWSNKENHS